MCIDDELEALRASVADLDSRQATIDEWRRIDARAFLALLGGQMHLTCMQRTMVDLVRARCGDYSWHNSHLEVGELVDKLAELRELRAMAQRRVFELEAETQQRWLSNPD